MKTSILALLILALCITSAAADGVVGHTLQIQGSDCTVSFTQGPFGGGGEGSQSGSALLQCGQEMLDLQFAYTYPELVFWSDEETLFISFALIRGSFQYLDPNGLELTYQLE